MGLIDKLDRFTRKNWLPRLNGDRAYIEHVNVVVDKINEIIDGDFGDNASLSGDNTFVGDNTFTGSTTFSENIQFAAGAYGVTAHAGGGQADATALPGFYNTVATVATAGDSCKLPVAVAGQMMIVAVAEDAAAAMDLFPATGGKINGGTANAAISLAPGTIAFCSCDVAGNWVVKLVYQKASPFKYLAYKASANKIVSTTSGVLVVGKTYIIAELKAGDDFSNVGYVSAGTPFEATATTPTTWTNSTRVYNITDLPTITVLATNFNGGVTIGYHVDGTSVVLALKSNAEFTENIISINSVTFVDSSTVVDSGLSTTAVKIEFYP